MWRRVTRPNVDEYLKRIIEAVEAKITGYKELSATDKRFQYWYYYNELKRSSVKVEIFRWKTREFPLKLEELEAEGKELGKNLSNYERRRVASATPTPSEYRSLLAEYNKLFREVSNFNGKVRRELEDPIKALSDQVASEENRLVEIRLRAKEREWRMPGRPGPSKRFETFVDAIRYIMRKIRYLKEVISKLLERVNKLFKKLPEKPEKPIAKKLFRVQVLYRVIKTPGYRSKYGREGTPETIAEIRLWYYVYADDEMEAENRIPINDIKKEVDTDLEQEFEGQYGTVHVFESLHNAKNDEAIELRVEKSNEAEEIDEDEPHADVGGPWEPEKVYREYTFFNKDGTPKAPPWPYRGHFTREAYNDEWIRDLIAGVVPSKTGKGASYGEGPSHWKQGELEARGGGILPRSGRMLRERAARAAKARSLEELMKEVEAGKQAILVEPVYKDVFSNILKKRRLTKRQEKEVRGLIETGKLSEEAISTMKELVETRMKTGLDIASLRFYLENLKKARDLISEARRLKPGKRERRR